ncbi:MAG: phosphotransferase enzyme family protein [Leadbetterella sp.]
MSNLSNIVASFDIDYAECTLVPFGSGLINTTYKVSLNTSKKSYILQKINTDVFKNPQGIIHNILKIQTHLNQYHPNYIFPGCEKTISGTHLLEINNEHWRLCGFIENSYSIDLPDTLEKAYQASKAFATLTKNLEHLDALRLEETIVDFHNLAFRFDQFKESCKNAIPKRVEIAKGLLEELQKYDFLVEKFKAIQQDATFPVRVMHHDTKINNVLFDTHTQSAKAVCDLDTLMPGKVYSDLGDMVRTYACSHDENSQDFNTIKVLPEYFKAIYTGYLEILGNDLTPSEKESIFYAGPFLIYMQSIRFLGDFLIGDQYYGSQFENQNFFRAKNQLVLLNSFFEQEKELARILQNI